jgi:hypothetical protein
LRDRNPVYDRFGSTSAAQPTTRRSRQPAIAGNFSAATRPPPVRRDAATPRIALFAGKAVEVQDDDRSLIRQHRLDTLA